MPSFMPPRDPSTGALDMGDLYPQQPTRYTPVDPRVGQGTISAYQPTLTDRLQSGLSSVLGQHMGERATNFLNDLSPVGAVTGAWDAGKQFANASTGPVTWGKAGMGAAALASLGASILPYGQDARMALQAGQQPLKGMFGRLLGDESGAIRAWHGSPHDFDQFDMSKIGTGEGAQAYGHGLYFAESPDVAKNYQTTLGGQRYSLNGQDLSAGSPVQQRAAQLLYARNGDPAAATELAQKYIADSSPHGMDKTWRAVNDFLSQNGGQIKAPGHLYEVNINADPHDFLNWDAPTWDQPQTVKDLLRQYGHTSHLEPPTPVVVQTASGKWTARNVWNEPIGTFADRQAAEAKSLAAHQRDNGGMLAYQQLGGNSIYHSLDKGDASRALLNQGVPGIKYLDQGSRGVGNGTSNYVVFDPSLISILNKH